MHVANLHLIHFVLSPSACVCDDYIEKAIPGNMEMSQTAVAMYVYNHSTCVDLV